MLSKGALDNCVTSRNIGRVYYRTLHDVLQKHLLELFCVQAGYGIRDGLKSLIGRDEYSDVWLSVEELNSTGGCESTNDAGEPSNSCGGGGISGNGEN